MSARKRVGLLVPSSNTVMEADLQRALLNEGTVHSARMHLVETTTGAESEMLDERFEPALTDLATARPHVIVFGCTSAGGLRGPDYDAQLCRRIETVSGATAVSTVAAAARSIRIRKPGSVAVLTPYVDALNAGIRSTFEAEGINVVAIEGLGITENFRLAEPTPETIEERAIRLMERSQAEMLFISCTNFRAVEAVSGIEERIGRTVLTSNLAVVEAVRRALG